MKKAEDLSHQELVDIVRRIQKILWLDAGYQGGFFYNPHKEWDSEHIEMVAAVMAKLRPEEGKEKYPGLKS